MATVAVTERQFARRPSFVLSTVAEIADSKQADGDERSYSQIFFDAGLTPAYYDHGKHRILVVPEVLEALVNQHRRGCGSLTPGLLQLVLVHEAAHALDAELGGLLFGQSPVSMRSRALLAEGHAQFVAERVARACGLDADFLQLSAVLHGIDCAQDVEAAEAKLLESRGSPYLEGLHFFQLAFRVGGTRLIIDLLSRPPEIPDAAAERLTLLRSRCAEWK